MCGIAGIVNLNGPSASNELLLEMTDAISHRGPDGEGYLLTENSVLAQKIRQQRPDAKLVVTSGSSQVLMGHRRLSILDLNVSAAQPMCDSSERYYIVFNGEIYNHATLRKELVLSGRKFLTDHSDTEVVLNAYAEWGLACLQKFNGMWAFCIWDKKENTFFLSRDRAGKKPLYYAVHNGNFYFASEMKSILKNREISRVLDDSALYDFLTYQMVPSPRTVFNAVNKLPAAHYMLFRPGEEIKITSYWTALGHEPYFNDSEADLTAKLREQMYEAARLRMLADVEVGVLLSGGVDSSVNLACLTKYASRPIKAFSVGFENGEGYSNEFAYARKVAKHFGADYRELTLSKSDFFEFLPKMVYYQDEPIADPANIPIYYISKTAANEGVKVLLGGEGSDELFVGYEHWMIARQFGQVLNKKPGLAAIAAMMHKAGPFKNKRTYYHGWYDKIKEGAPNFWSGSEIRSEQTKKSILSERLLRSIPAYSSFDPLRVLYGIFEKGPRRDGYDWMSATDLQYRLPDLLLARLDRMMMAASVEGRNPFLDVNMINFAMRIPPQLKTKNGESKYMLKKAFEGILPNEILYRKKDSFTVPLAQLFNDTNYRSMSIDAINTFNNKTNIFRKDYLATLEKNPDAVEFWNITNLALWHQSACQ